MGYILLFVYMLSGNLVVERDHFETKESCFAAGKVRAEFIDKLPGYEGAYIAGCVPVKLQKV